MDHTHHNLNFIKLHFCVTFSSTNREKNCKNNKILFCRNFFFYYFVARGTKNMELQPRFQLNYYAYVFFFFSFFSFSSCLLLYATKKEKKNAETIIEMRRKCLYIEHTFLYDTSIRESLDYVFMIIYGGWVGGVSVSLSHTYFLRIILGKSWRLFFCIELFEFIKSMN